MKKLFGLAVFLIASSVTTVTTLNAAPANRTAPEIATPSWTGFYFGGDVGGLSQHTHAISDFFQTDSVHLLPELEHNNPENHSPNITSAIGGIHAGFNWQFAPSWVIGIEGDWQPKHLRDTFCRQTDIQSQPCVASGRGFATVGDETGLIGTARARFGWAFERTMIYGTGGAAFANVKTSLGVNCPNGCADSSNAITTAIEASSHKTGWVTGAGIERMFGQNWIVRAEYLHVRLGSASHTLFLPATNCFSGPCGLTASHDISYDIVRAGVSYKFGGF